MLCDYGCGKEALYTFKNGKHCCSKNVVECPSVKQKNSQTLKDSYASGKRKVVTDHLEKFRAWSRGKTAQQDPRIRHKHEWTPETVFCENSKAPTHLVRKMLLNNPDFCKKHNINIHRCAKCGVTDVWNGEHLGLEIHHINGINTDHRPHNIIYLCPNCHSQTENFKGRNKNIGIKKVSDEDLIAALKENDNIYNALIAVGLNPKGGNYPRARRLLESMETPVPM